MFTARMMNQNGKEQKQVLFTISISIYYMDVKIRPKETIIILPTEKPIKNRKTYLYIVNEHRIMQHMHIRATYGVRLFVDMCCC